MAKKKDVEIVLGEERLLRPFPFMKPPIGNPVDKPRSNTTVRIAWTIAAAAVFVLSLTGNVLFSSAKTEMKAGLARTEDACALDKKQTSRECQYQKMRERIKANAGRSWTR